MLIAFTGSHSTGKTTLIDRLKEHYKGNDQIQYVDSCTRKVGKEHPINNTEKDYTLTQLRILEAHLENIHFSDLTPNRISILDRCLIDGLIYTMQLVKEGKVDRSVGIPFLDAVEHHAFHYEIIFYIPAEIELVKDGVRSEDLEFKKNIDELFNSFFSTFGKSFNLIEVKGSIDERFEIVTKHIDNLFYE